MNFDDSPNLPSFRKDSRKWSTNEDGSPQAGAAFSEQSRWYLNLLITIIKHFKQNND